jgi:ribosome-associated toxin RatA of RatAB toxin-antitoxin module
MAILIIQKVVPASIDQAYASWADDFGNIQKFHPHLKSSFSINNSPESGLGAERQCNLDDGKSWVKERVVEARAHDYLKVDIYEGNVPLKNAYIELFFEPEGDETKVTMEFHFQAAIPVLGRLMEPMMKKKFSSVLKNLLYANAQYLTAPTEAAA